MDEKRDSFNFYIQGKHLLHFILYVMFCLCFHIFFFPFAFVFFLLFCLLSFVLSSLVLFCCSLSFLSFSFLVHLVYAFVLPPVFVSFLFMFFLMFFGCLFFKFCFLFKFQEILQQTIDELSNKERYFTLHLLYSYFFQAMLKRRNPLSCTVTVNS